MPSLQNKPHPKGGKRGAAVALALILSSIFLAEGGYVNDPNDPGGATNYGITERVARNAGYDGDMRDLPKEKAAEIYREKYIDQPGYGPLVEADPAVAQELVDTGVNAGYGRSSRWLQESLNHLNYRGQHWADIAEDGQVGPATMRAYAALQRKRGPKAACEVLLKMLNVKQGQHYNRLASNNSKFETFVFGWYKRVDEEHDFSCDDAKRL